jgi:hypothetical protein
MVESIVEHTKVAGMTSVPVRHGKEFDSGNGGAYANWTCFQSKSCVVASQWQQIRICMNALRDMLVLFQVHHETSREEELPHGGARGERHEAHQDGDDAAPSVAAYARHGEGQIDQ